jgi:uncharacterized protein YecE (DUF72 family)
MSRTREGRISIGIGSWTDKDYTGVIYPKGLPDNQRLATYATHFSHVEVNASYHRVPPAKFVQNWVRQTPENFTFDLKLPRDVSTNPRRAAESGKSVERLLKVAQPMIEAKKLGAFFLVLPPSFSPEKHVLEELDLLVDTLRPHLLAVELRHRGWVTGDQRERTLSFYRERKLVWIAVDMPKIAGSTLMPVVDAVTNPELAYLRCHGRRPDWETQTSAAEKHRYLYSARELRELAARARGLAREARCVRVVANNHAEDFAPRTALALQALLRGGGGDEGAIPGRPTRTRARDVGAEKGVKRRAKPPRSAGPKIPEAAPKRPRRLAAQPRR